jgi:hypothetical protein
MHIDRTWNGTHLLGNLRCDRVVVGYILSHDLNIERSRDSEVQRLRDDVGRFEVERCPRKAFWQFLPQVRDVVSRGVVIWLQRRQNIRIGIADRSAVAVRQIDAAGRLSDVVENPAKLIRRYLSLDIAIDLIYETSCLFNARPGLCPHVKQELPGIHCGKEVLPEPRYQHET